MFILENVYDNFFYGWLNLKNQVKINFKRQFYKAHLFILIINLLFTQC